MSCLADPALQRYFAEVCPQKTLVRLVQTSRALYKACVPHLYTHIVLKSETQMRLFLRMVSLATADKDLQSFCRRTQSIALETASDQATYMIPLLLAIPSMTTSGHLIFRHLRKCILHPYVLPMQHPIRATALDDPKLLAKVTSLKIKLGSGAMPTDSDAGEHSVNAFGISGLKGIFITLGRQSNDLSALSNFIGVQPFLTLVVLDTRSHVSEMLEGYNLSSARDTGRIFSFLIASYSDHICDVVQDLVDAYATSMRSLIIIVSDEMIELALNIRTEVVKRMAESVNRRGLQFEVLQRPNKTSAPYRSPYQSRSASDASLFAVEASVTSVGSKDGTETDTLGEEDDLPKYSVHETDARPL